ncbi:MAG TPA: serine/threonine-protein kinase PknK, partial [Paraburkholderia sp.]|uniref:ATP-binding protein n=1 Tax=Paraburkholderia sp. TaxID=1926495 RepID=UPI002CDA5F8F
MREDGDCALCREWHLGADGRHAPVLVARLTAEHPTPVSLDRLSHECSLKDELENAWAVRPLELVREGGRMLLLLEDACGEPLERLLGTPLEIGRFLRLAIGIIAAMGKMHQRGLVHKDVKPANILVNPANAEVRLTGFGIASRLPRERQAPEPPETIAGTLAYMAPEQTGRMNRSIDARSDLYALGVTLYQMLTGVLPFTASDPLEWVHCHIARKPVPPHERVASVPATISAIVMKLLAKTADDRYQTAGGVEHDLRRCLSQWEKQGLVDPFPIGERDIPDRLLIPEKLYGREREVETLLAAFGRVVKSGVPELVLVSGYSGIGKSSVVNELHKVLVPPRGLFAAGKFDQYRRDIPYATLAQTLQSLVRPLLGKSEADLCVWRSDLRKALGPNGQLMVDLVPELELILGQQPRVPPLEPQQAQGRFQLVIRRFIGVFARPGHQLALFLDDLQWIDVATLDLLEDLLTRSDLRHLMLIGAYRDNEVSPAHPLMRKLDVIRAAGGKVGQITLVPLGREHLGHLLADTLRCKPEDVAPLARLVHEKTAGNPFFATQFMTSLADEGLLAFEHDAGRWSWDLDRMDAKGYTENVVDLMIGKLARLPGETQEALRQLACLGNLAQITTLALVLGTSRERVDALLWPAVRQEFVECLPGAYRFVHDRVREAAYSVIPEGLRGEMHLRIGRLLATHTPLEKREEAIFDIVNQLNRGAALISARDEREQLAGFNLLAGKRAKASVAYASALNYAIAGAALLEGDDWQTQRELVFALEYLRAECEFLTGDMAAAEQRLSLLARRTDRLAQRAMVACLRIEIFMTLDRRDRSVEVGLEYLKHVGVVWPQHPTQDKVQQEFDRIWQHLGNQSIEALIDAPLMHEAGWQSTMDVLTALLPPALFTDEHLFR